MTSSVPRQLVECVPNFSEGRDGELIDGLADAASSVDGAAVLDVAPDRWHNRTVITMVGEPDPLAESVFRAVVEAADRIDLNEHEGEHPRIGAADVVPFVPLDDLELDGSPGVDIHRCVTLAGRLGRRIADELRIPVFLYGEAARRAGRNVPASFRKGGFETLRETIEKDPDRKPDFGPPRVHATAGAAAVGARRILVAYNVFLDTDDVEIARRIARSIRASGGGLPHVQALGFRVDGRAQVSTNLLRVRSVPPLEVFEAVQREAGEEGVEVAGSEIVGLAPEEALPDDARESLMLNVDPAEKSLERKIREAYGG